MSRDAIHAERAPRAVGPYSHAVRAGDVVFLSGQVGLNPATGALVAEAVSAQARQAFANLEAVLHAAGLTLRDVVKVNVYLTDMADFAEMNAVYAEVFDAPYPARTTVAVHALPGGARVEVEAIAR